VLLDALQRRAFETSCIIMCYRELGTDFFPSFYMTGFEHRELKSRIVAKCTTDSGSTAYLVPQHPSLHSLHPARTPVARRWSTVHNVNSEYRTDRPLP
jgi:hypothetical protein